MVSRLDSIYRTEMRHAESTDTHRGIHREDTTDDRRRKDEDRERAEDAAIWEDQTILSATALHAFLKGLIANNSYVAPRAQAEDTAPQAPEATAPEPANRARQAAGAYAATARNTHSDYCDVPPHHPPAAATTPLSAEEITSIQNLIKDLETLMARGLHEILLLKGDNFLQSLVDAVALAKASSL